jgi:integrase
LGKGSICKKQRAGGLTWIYRFGTTRAADGKKVENTRPVGLVKDIGSSEAAAWREVWRLRLDQQANGAGRRQPTFGELTEHFRKHELKKESGVGVKANETVSTTELLLDKHILPRWGHRIASEIRPLELEGWFEALTLQPSGTVRPFSWATVRKLKSMMSLVYKHAQRHELIAATVDGDGRPTNPTVLARCESHSEYEAVVVTPEQMIMILQYLSGPDTQLEWTLALLHAATALRPEEAFGLQWGDVDWKNSQINIKRGWSKGKVTGGKTAGSMTHVVMHPVLGEVLADWRRETCYAEDGHWIFASKKNKGKTPRTPSTAAQDYLRPPAVKAGVIPEGYSGRFGWHNLRHSLATFLVDKVELKVIQLTLRHSRMGTTGIYTHRSKAPELAAQEKFLVAINMTKAVD